MSLKTKFAQKLRNLLGVQQLSSMVNQELRTNRALSILSSLGLPKDVELSLQLALYPQPNEKSGITLLTSTQEYLMIKNYLSLVRPFKSRSLHLARIGGRGDGGYVMLDIESDVESKANDANNISHNNCPPPQTRFR